MLKDHSVSNDNGSEKENRSFVAILRGVIGGRKLKGRKLVDELLGHPLFIRRLRSICYSLTGNFTDAQDLFSEICLKLCSPPKKGRRRKIRLRQFKPDWDQPYGNFFSWLKRVTRRAFFDSKRGLEHQSTAESIDELEIPSVDDFEDQFELNDRKITLRNGIKALPPKPQMALILHIYEGYSTREVAVIMTSKGLPCTHASVAGWLRKLVAALFPEAKQVAAAKEPPRKPNARARAAKPKPPSRKPNARARARSGSTKKKVGQDKIEEVSLRRKALKR